MILPFRTHLSDPEKDQLLFEQDGLIKRQAARIADLEAALKKPKKTSSNSHTPPSQNDPGRENRSPHPSCKRRKSLPWRCASVTGATELKGITALQAIRDTSTVNAPT